MARFGRIARSGNGITRLEDDKPQPQRRTLDVFGSIVSLVAAIALLLWVTNRVGGAEVGQLQVESKSVKLGQAKTVRAEIQMGAGELYLAGGAAKLLEARFIYNIAEWKPQIFYQVSDKNQGHLIVQQPHSSSKAELKDLNDIRYKWDLRLNNNVPLDLSIALGPGRSEVNLDGLLLTSLNLDLGQGEAIVDLSGNWQRDLAVNIKRGIGGATLRLPADLGVRIQARAGPGTINASGFKKEGDSYTNKAFGQSDVTLFIDLDKGVGQINFETVDVPLGQPGAATLGDPYYPWMGNGGYDALHYALDLAVEMPTNTLSGTVTMAAQATQDLSAFNLDFLGFEISEITVNNTPAVFSRAERELTIKPATPLASGEPFTVTTTYRGVATPAPDPALPALPGVGWVHNEAGVFVLNQPSGASAWFPVNDHPLDKATYSFRITVAKPFGAIAPGLLQDIIDNGSTTTFVWEARNQLASYLATVNIAELLIRTEMGPSGLPIRHYFPAETPPEITRSFWITAEQISYFSQLLGPYPFETYGLLVMADDNFTSAGDGHTLATCSRMTLAEREVVLARKLAQQWIGHSVSIKSWQDIWINEGFATYAAALWVEHKEGPEALEQQLRAWYNHLAPNVPTTQLSKARLVQNLKDLSLDGVILSRQQILLILHDLFNNSLPEAEVTALLAEVPVEGLPGEQFADLIEALTFETLSPTSAQLAAAFRTMGLPEVARQFPPVYAVPGKPSIEQLFSPGVCQRSALTFAALRLRVGDEAFFEIMRTYSSRYQHSNAGTTDFIAVAEEVTGQDLDTFFSDWLYAEPLPDIPELGLIAADPLSWRSTPGSSESAAVVP